MFLRYSGENVEEVVVYGYGGRIGVKIFVSRWLGSGCSFGNGDWEELVEGWEEI